ncbi:MAG: citrate/2-methylcitrate synthase, partial [Balneolaceae bacterium]|nr:citrate/2-methylcitrate synthase [Balneolaceae bacterium]
MAETVKTDIDLSQYPHINKGLDGIVAFSTHKSFIDGQKGELIYDGYSIETLAENATFEEVCFLLWHDRLPDQQELDDLNRKMQNQRSLPEPVIRYIHNTSNEAEPMSVLRTAVSMLGDFHDPGEKSGKEVWIDKAITIAAKMPTVIAAFDRIRNGKDPVDPLP